jgi:Ice-binding-like
MRRSLISFGFAALIVLILPATALAATDPGLGGAGNFAVLAGTDITNTGPSWISGQIGVGPGSSITGLTPPTATTGPQLIDGPVVTTAKTNLTAAYTNAANAPCPATNNLTNVNLGGKILVPGVYCQTSAPTLTGTLTLNGPGIYIFQIGSTLITAPGARVVLIGGAQPCDIFWQVSSSATIATTTTFVGNIMALTSIAMQTGATLWGRALSQTGAVTLDTNRIIQPSGCTTGLTPNFAAPAPVPAPVPNSGNLPASLGTIVTAPAAVLPGNTGVPLELRGQFPWLLLIAVGAGVGASVMGVSSRRRRRRRA